VVEYCGVFAVSGTIDMNSRVLDVCQKVAVGNEGFSRRTRGKSRMAAKPFPLLRRPGLGDRQQPRRGKSKWNCRRARQLAVFRGNEGGRTAAILSSFIPPAAGLEINPFTYLRDIFDRISAHPVKRLEELLPDNWKAAQTATQALPV
jgi:hypothetical protein